MSLLKNGNTHLRFIKDGIILCGRCVIYLSPLTMQRHYNTGWDNEQKFNESRVISLYSACILHMHNKTIFSVLVFVFYFLKNEHQYKNILFLETHLEDTFENSFLKIVT